MNFRYVGEWFEPKGEDGGAPVPLEEQQQLVSAALWNAVFIYLVIGGVSGAIVVVQSLRGRLL